MYKYIQGFRRLLDDIQIQKDTVIEERRAKQPVYDIFRQKILSLRLFPYIAHGVEHTKHMTAWQFNNTCTGNIKTLSPAVAFRSTARLGKFFASKF